MEQQHWFEGLEPILKPEDLEYLIHLENCVISAGGRAKAEHESQRAFVYSRSRFRMDCWLCGQGCNVYEASLVGQGTVQYKGTANKDGVPLDTFRCIRCRVLLRHVVPIVQMGGPGWHWTRPKDIHPKEILSATAEWEKRVEGTVDSISGKTRDELYADAGLGGDDAKSG